MKGSFYRDGVWASEQPLKIHDRSDGSHIFRPCRSQYRFKAEGEGEWEAEKNNKAVPGRARSIGGVDKGVGNLSSYGEDIINESQKKKGLRKI